MNVRFKTTLMIFTSFLLLMILAFIIFNFAIFKYIDRIETKGVDDSFQIVNSLISREKKNMEATSIDWSHWDETYNFMLGENTSYYIKNNFGGNTLKELNLNFMAFVDTKGGMVYSISNGLKNSIKSELEDRLFKRPDNFKKITTFKNNDEIRSGIIDISGKEFIVTISPITTTNKNMKSNGNLILGKFINDSFLSYMSSVTKSKAKFVRDISSRNMEGTVVKKDNDYITGYRTIRDINGNMSITMSITIMRYEYKLGKFYFIILILIFLLLAFIVSCILLVIFNKCILNRFKSINEFINKVSQNKDMSVRLNISGNDEIANVANSTNGMLSQLESAYKDILILSYFDKLTGLRNRTYVEQKFDELNLKSVANYCMIIGDINGMKLINDKFGHREGDRLICTIANVLKKVCSKDDIAARWSGDEFIVLIIDKEYSYSSSLMQNIKGECEKVMNFNFEISIAWGIAEKSHHLKLEEVMNLAEERMYRSKLVKIKSSRNAIIASLEKILYEKHSETEEHTQRVKELSVKLGRKLNLSQEQLEELELLSLLHDIGKIGIPDNVLMKPGKLTDEEWDIMKKHTEIGYRIAKATPGLSHVANEILCHHEKFDGTGYPQGLKEGEIPILSRIINIIDSFDVMTHKRIYKNANDMNYAIKELERCSETQFDPHMVREFIKLLKK
ncbi:MULTISPECIES: HD domain-containing phosphohydrolase [Clostridium]|uniref:Cyclic di-GMP phosphodiesterase response regulator RpfG n=1 Tax=Clostridium ljungdahlii (strain ATCC 55383 / DSM 13528 / PETC) TaxID=748727 RepID=D8GJI9_CLOLD|nr:MULTISPECIES: HD domain-containing phosphohydrolase [Clostridium]ADK15150.1 putative sensor protein with GGDEF domain [Clostridium ljungdahlii DSM 13528]ALU34595.1 Diguanylate cyclase and metal dependent phosphohydrolase [Clostridium autoethanogenum DSM 10061]OAA88627.1 Cyclic di-GMP phosphodiesterase response regulator RpfG [Clostridium ljungdahlii DSM 13528]OVY51315.1 Cyclic di-GMP phosphodiesterase response regulator RpfG [Clostridium autoethanogenum]